LHHRRFRGGPARPHTDGGRRVELHAAAGLLAGDPGGARSPYAAPEAADRARFLTTGSGHGRPSVATPAAESAVRPPACVVSAPGPGRDTNAGAGPGTPCAGGCRDGARPTSRGGATAAP